MDTGHALTPLAARDLLVGIAPFVIGLAVVGILILAVAYGMRLRRQGDMRPSEPSPPRPPGPEGYGKARTGPAEMPHDGRRRLPYEVKDQGVTGTDDDPDEEPPRWGGGGSSFGSGGPGHTG